MPRYDFKCSCGAVFEKVVPIAERKETLCSCGKTARQMISAPWQRIDINSDRWETRHKKRG